MAAPDTEQTAMPLERGAKRRCGACGTPFYDLRRTPIVCPKCGTTHEPPTWTSRKRAAPTPTGRDPEVVAAAAREAEDKDGDDVAEDDDEAKDDAAEDDVGEADEDDGDKDDEAAVEPTADEADADDATPGRGAAD